MALKIGGTTVINDSRGLENISNLKTVNGQSILGTGDLTIAGSNSFVSGIILHNEYDPIKIGKAPHKNGGWSSVQNYCIGGWPMTYNKTGIYNIAIGNAALQGSIDYINPSDTSQKTYANVKGNVGMYNTAIGHSAIKNNYSGERNVAIGNEAMVNGVSASNTVAIGYTAFGGAAGASNIAIGNETLTKNTNFGEHNIAVGENSLTYNLDGGHNIAVGHYALHHNTIGINNIAVGAFAMGQLRESLGYGELPSGYTGCNNLAIGNGALGYKKTGGGNTAIGHESLKNLKDGYGNIGIGESSPHATSPERHVTHAPVFNVIDESNRIVMGHTSITNAYIQVAWTVVSDARDKTNFSAIPHGLDFVNQLKPTAYQFRTERSSEVTNGGVRYGFKAQDIAAIEPEAVIVDTTDPEKFYYNESNLVPVLVKALQELTTKNDALEERLTALERRMM